MVHQNRNVIRWLSFTLNASLWISCFLIFLHILGYLSIIYFHIYVYIFIHILIKFLIILSPFLLSTDFSTLLLITTLLCWDSSKEESSTIFWVVMTRSTWEWTLVSLAICIMDRMLGDYGCQLYIYIYIYIYTYYQTHGNIQTAYAYINTREIYPASYEAKMRHLTFVWGATQEASSIPWEA